MRVARRRSFACPSARAPEPSATRRAAAVRAPVVWLAALVAARVAAVRRAAPATARAAALWRAAAAWAAAVAAARAAALRRAVTAPAATARHHRCFRLVPVVRATG